MNSIKTCRRTTLGHAFTIMAALICAPASAQFLDREITMKAGECAATGGCLEPYTEPRTGSQPTYQHDAAAEWERRQDAMRGGRNDIADAYRWKDRQDELMKNPNRPKTDTDIQMLKSSVVVRGTVISSFAMMGVKPTKWPKGSNEDRMERLFYKALFEGQQHLAPKF